MSGIVAMAGPACAPHDWQWAQDATAYMAFRGPDGSSVWRDDYAALGHACLRTADDQDTRSQPFHLDGGGWVTGDVRLDGRDDLIAQLRRGDPDITSRTDETELLLRAYERWGDRCVDHISGDFAFAIWDQRQRRLFCATDQFGVVPLYYAIAGSRVFVSNTLDCLLLHNAIPDDLHDPAIADFLMFGMNMDRTTTTFASIRRLAPGHAMTWADGVVTIRQYWSPAWNGFVRYKTAGEYHERFRELLTQSVADRLRTNRVSVQLSGGLDSTSVAVIAHRLLAAGGRRFDLKAHTIVLDGLMPDEEGRYAGMVAEAEGISAEVLPAAEYPRVHPREAPVSVTPEPIPYCWTDLEYDIVARASRHGRVALTGQGGDSALMYMPSYWIEWIVRGHWARLGTTVWEHVRLFGTLPTLYLRPSLRHFAFRRQAKLRTPSWLNEAFARSVGLRGRSARLYRESSGQIDTRGMAVSSGWASILGRFDAGFTRMPLKYRHPFFDVRLVSYLLALPPSPWFPRKALLRDAMRGILPAAVVERRKTPLAKALTVARATAWPLTEDDIAFLGAAPGLERYVARDAFAIQLRNGGATDPAAQGPVTATLGLSHWMQHRPRPRTMPRQNVHLENLAREVCAVVN